MKQATILNLLAVMAAGILASSPVLAASANSKKGETSSQQAQHSKKYFKDEHKTAISEYYEEQFLSTHRCPPGLTRNYDGCVPSDKAHKWKTGQPLPRNATTYDLPPEIVARIGPPPSGHRYVRVDSDILLITTGTSLIVDIIEDLGR